ncbi:MAG TPA: cytochrome c [Gemmataceae bacterium]
MSTDADRARPAANGAQMRPPEEVAEPFDVTGMHTPIWREHEEPRDGLEPVPSWVTLTFWLFLFWGGFYVARYSADFRPHVYDGEDVRFARGMPPPERIPQTPEDLIRMGRRIYTANCQVCHQAGGEGQDPQYPPLAGSEWVVGAEASPERLSRILLYGLTGPITVAGKPYNAQMPAWGAQLKDHQIAAVLTFVRQELQPPDRKGEPILPATVSAVREEVGARGPMTVEELRAIPVEEQKPKEKAEKAPAPQP